MRYEFLTIKVLLQSHTSCGTLTNCAVHVLFIFLKLCSEVSLLLFWSGALYDASNTYDVPFYISGATFIVSACLFYVDRLVRRCRKNMVPDNQQKDVEDGNKNTFQSNEKNTG